MFKILAIDHIVLNTDCMDVMVRFYCDILGGRVEKTQPDFGLTQIRVGDNLIDLLAVEGPIQAEGQNLAHFCLRIQPFDIAVLSDYFAQHDIDIQRFASRYGAQGQGDSFYLHDPQGNEIELCEARSQ